MTIIDRLRAVEKQLGEIWKLLMAIRAAGGGGGGGPHNLLSGTHTDTTAGAPLRGDIIVADLNPKWKKLAKAAAGLLLGYDANDVVAINPNTLTVADSDKLDGQHAAAFQAAGTVPAHHASHEGAGGGAGADKIKLDDLDTPDNNTDLNASASRHGLLPILDNTATKFLRDDGTWQTVTAGASNAVKLWTPDAPPASPTAQDDQFADASIDAKWHAFQAGGGISVAESGTFLKYTHTGDGAYQWRGHFQALPAGDFTIICKLADISPFFNYWSIGLCLFADATNNPNTCALYCFTNELAAASSMTRITKLNNWQSFAGSPKDVSQYSGFPPYLRLRQGGTTLYFDYSFDGVGWIIQFSEARWFTPAEMGFICWNHGATTAYGWFDYFLYKASNDVFPPGALEEFWVT